MNRIIFLLLLSLLSTGMAHGVDKGGVSPNVVSLLSRLGLNRGGWGLPRYEPNGLDDDFDDLIDEADEENRFLDLRGEELVLTGQGHYFPENQESFIRWYRRENHWWGVMKCA